MKALSIIDCFVFFSNLESIVTNDIPTLVKIFEDFKMTQRQENTKEGPITVTSFAKQNCAISFRKNRIDVEFANKPNAGENEAVMYAVDTLKKIKQYYPTLSGNRVSYIGTSFIPNKNNEPLVDLIDNIGLSSAFGPSNEFQFRLNSPITIGREKCNAVLTVQQGNVQDQNRQNLPAIICVNDINTVFTDKTNRFELDDVESIYLAFKAKAVEKNEKILALIEDAVIAS